MREKSRFIPTILVIIIAILLGSVISGEVNSFIAIEYNEKEPVTANTSVPVPADIDLPDIDTIEAIYLPTNQSNYDMYDLGATELQDIIENRTGNSPPILNASVDRPAGMVISIGTHDRNIYSTELTVNSEFDESSFLINTTSVGDNTTVTIHGGSNLGDVYGIYWLINELQTGLTLDAQGLRTVNTEIIPESEFRLIGPGALGMSTNPSLWDHSDYSLSNRRYTDLFLVDDPYINQTAFQELREDFKEYVRLSIANGYNYIRMSGFINMIDFAYVGDGHVIYEEGSQYLSRHQATREALGSLYEYARSLGMGVIVGTDMVALSEPLKQYFITKYGSINPDTPEFWDVYKEGVRELFDRVPMDGIMIRIGEAGSAYNTEEALYSSELVVKNADQTRDMLQALLDVHEEKNKSLIFRTWSVGVGEIGDMHTNTETYRLLLDDISSPNLIVSTKYTMGDFYAYLPYNPTLLIGEHKRIIEFQARREFEGFNAFPNYMATVHKQALQYFKDNKQIIGIWLWSQAGGPPRTSPFSLYPFAGFWLYTDANVYATSQLAWNWDADIGEITQSWVVKWFGTNTQLVANYTTMMLLSPLAVEKGLYISEFAKQQVLAFGLEPPPMLWIFEWDIVVGVSSVLSVIYETVKDNMTAVIEEGFDALTLVTSMRGLISGFDDPGTLPDGWFAMIEESLQYQHSLFDTLAWYRSYFLNYYAWLDQGGATYNEAFVVAQQQFEQKKNNHLQSYSDNLDFPSYNFFEVDRALKVYRRNQLMMWLARIMVVAILAFFVLARQYSQLPGSRQAQRILTNIIDPGRLDSIDEKQDWSVFGITTFGYALGLGIFTQFLAPMVTLAFILLAIVPTAIVAGINKVLDRPQPIMTTQGVNLMVMTVLMSVVAIRGPSWFWYQFWITTIFRSVFISMLIVAFIYKSYLIYRLQANGEGRYNHGLALGSMVLSLGLWMILLGGILGLSGLEQALTTLNEELLLIPFALSVILGITVHLDIPLSIPSELVSLGVIFTGIGIFIMVLTIGLRKQHRNEN